MWHICNILFLLHIYGILLIGPLLENKDELKQAHANDRDGSQSHKGSKRNWISGRCIGASSLLSLHYFGGSRDITIITASPSTLVNIEFRGTKIKMAIHFDIAIKRVICHAQGSFNARKYLLHNT